jgi:putative lipoprotein
MRVPALLACLFPIALAGCSSPPGTVPSSPLVTGSVTYLERIALTPDAVVEVKVLGGHGGTTIASCRTTDPVQVPVAFAIPVASGNVRADGKVAISATITDRGRVMWTTPEPVPFTLGRGDSDVGTITLKAVASDPADPER